jgi:uncharacterized repeat protein (TIGR03843 family)
VAEQKPPDRDDVFRQRDPITTDRALKLLSEGEVEILGRMPYSSNMTYLVDIGDEDLLAQAIYKPYRGERSLWDFPGGLYKREVAAFEISEQIGWEVVPPTVLKDGPLGIGSLQLFCPSDFSQHYFTLMETAEHHESFRQICAFDIIANNTDRKSGHCLLGDDKRIWAIDNGLSFHAEFKLRTVIWEFAGDQLPSSVVVDIEEFLDVGLPDSVSDLLNPVESEAVLARARGLLIDGEFPTDLSGRRYPWPLV